MSKLGTNIKSHLGIYGPAFILVIAGFMLAYQFIQPAPPNTIHMATGDPEGAYHGFAQKYQRQFKREGITLELVETAGSVDNLALLTDGKVDIAFVQGGTRIDNGETELQALGSLYFEPLWLFLQQHVHIDQLNHLSARSIAIGPKGSGTNALVKRLLAANGSQKDSDIDENLQANAAVTALLEAQISAAFFVSGPDSQLIQDLLHSPTLHLANLERSPAYAQRFSFLHDLLLLEGTIDLQQDIPPQDTHLIATTANLIASKELHPAIVGLLLQVASRVHGDAGLFKEEGQFPSPAYQEFPLHDAANRYFEHGAPFLQRYLPFWAASLIDRIKIMLLPLLVLMLPLFKVMPPIYQWRMNRKVYRWYEQLEVIEQQLGSAVGNERTTLIAKFSQMDEDVRNVDVPASFSSKLYQLRHHIYLVSRKYPK